jgi:hypothetical protein
LYCLYLELRLLITPLVFSLFSIVLSVLRITASDYLFGLFRLFLQTIIILVNCLFGVLFQTWAEYVISGAVVLIPITVACSVYGAMNGSGLVFGRLELSHNVWIFWRNVESKRIGNNILTIKVWGLAMWKSSVCFWSNK